MDTMEIYDQYELIIVGGGIGGYTAALQASQLGVKTALVERSNLGGTYVNSGALPSLMYCNLTRIIREFNGIDPKNFRLSKPLITFKELTDHKDDMVEQRTKSIVDSLLEGGVDIYYGIGRVFPNKTVRIDTADDKNFVLCWDKLILATGSSPVIPKKFKNISGIKTNIEFFQAQKLYENTVLVGGGTYACEIAAFLGSVGVNTTFIVNKDSLIEGMDRESERFLLESLTSIGVKVLYDASVETIYRDSVGNYHLEVDTKSDILSISAEEIILCCGRESNTFGTEALNLKLHRGWIDINDQLQTTMPNIYAIGDVTGKTLTASTAKAMGIQAVENMFTSEARPMNFKLVPTCVFTSTEVASVGLTEEEARKEYGDIYIGRYYLDKNDRAIVTGNTEGYIKIITNGENEAILGVHIVGSKASELIALAKTVIAMGGDVYDFERLIYPSPTMSEGFREAALDVSKQLNDRKEKA